MSKTALDRGISSLPSTASIGDFTLHFNGHEEEVPQVCAKICKAFVLSRRVENCSQETQDTYEKRLMAFFRFVKKPAEEVTRTDIDFYMLHLKETVSKQGAKRSPFTVRSNYVALRAFFNWMVAEEFITKSPLTTLKLPKVPKYAKAFLSEEQFQRMLQVCPSNFIGFRSRAWLWLLWSTGARLSEIARLQQPDLDWDRGRIRVVGKGDKERYIPFTQDAQKAVYKYLGKRQDKLPALWLTEERQPATKEGLAIMTERIYHRAMDHHCANCGQTFAGIEFSYERFDCPKCHSPLKGSWDIKDAHHIFRRTWAYRQLKAGISMKFVQLIGGWESVAVLEQYVKLMNSEDALDGNIKWV